MQTKNRNNKIHPQKAYTAVATLPMQRVPANQQNKDEYFNKYMKI